jgi:hypothetical protein
MATLFFGIWLREHENAHKGNKEYGVIDEKATFSPGFSSWYLYRLARLGW